MIGFIMINRTILTHLTLIKLKDVINLSFQILKEINNSKIFIIIFIIIFIRLLNNIIYLNYFIQILKNI